MRACFSLFLCPQPNAKIAVQIDTWDAITKRTPAKILTLNLSQMTCASQPISSAKNWRYGQQIALSNFSLLLQEIEKKQKNLPILWKMCLLHTATYYICMYLLNINVNVPTNMKFAFIHLSITFCTIVIQLDRKQIPFIQKNMSMYIRMYDVLVWEHIFLN